MPRPQEPKAWLKPLYERLRARQPQLLKARNYYEGQHNLAFATKKFQEAFGGLFKEFSDNWCGVVVQAAAERLQVQGIRIGAADKEQRPGKLLSPEDHDRDAWEMWQRNKLDAHSSTHHMEILSTGYGHVIVWADGDGEPMITVEDPLQVIVAYDAEPVRHRAAALKVWRDEWTDHDFATLYLPDGLYKFQSEKAAAKGSSEKIRWVERRVADEDWPLPNPLEEVPVVEFTNDPTVLGRGRSEISRVIPIQNAVNKIVTDMMVASEFVAFPQRAIIGWTPDDDPETGAEQRRQLEQALSRILTFENKEVQIAEWTQARIDGHIKFVEMLVHHIAAQTRTPRHYLIQMGQMPSGDAMKSAETGLVAKVGERASHYGEDWEEVFRLGFKVKEDPKANVVDSETIWKDPEFRTEAELTDAVIKQHETGLVPWRFALERLGYSPQEIDRMEKMRMTDTLTSGGLQLGNLVDDEPAPEPEGAPAA